jgi:pimeloyl-ACP methyl ester carboxylesterase
MNVMRQESVQCWSPEGFHDMAYVEWGDPGNSRVLLCVHGLTRCGRDFDALATALADVYRVVCPDVAGRGRSGWLANKDRYGLPQYCADMVTLIARLQPATLHWVGTSMGGLIGMAMASQAGTPIARLVLDDVGPVIPAAALARIGDFLGQAQRFASMDEAERYVRTVSAPFGPLTDAQWRHLTVHTVRQLADGGFELAYDPGIAIPFCRDFMPDKDVEFWPVFDAIACPTLVVRGAQSDLLTADTALAMTVRGPRASLFEVAGVGHAPMLMEESQISAVRSFLLG